MTQAQKPPPTLATARVLEYAILDQSVRYSGHSNLFSGDREVGPVPCLAICQDREGTEILLFHCDWNWTILGSAGRKSIQDAKASAEETYAGVSSLWTDAHVSEQDAAQHLEEIWGGQRCNFCGRSPLDLDAPCRMIEKNGSWICEPCVRACYQLIQSDQQGK